MSIDAAFLNVLTDGDRDLEGEVLQVLGSILRRGAFVIEEVETIAAAARNVGLQAEARCFARQSLQWLAQQSAMATTPLRKPSANARN